MMEFLFWFSVAGVLYPYLGYPLMLRALGLLIRRRGLPSAGWRLPSVSLIIPVHNEESRVAKKIENTAALRYPDGRLQVLFVSDGSTDRTVEMLRQVRAAATTVVELPVRGGKAAALNAGLAAATNEIVVFSDASIELQPDSLERLVGRFEDSAIGCVSGEDRIADGGGEGLYGRYELMLRRLESRIHSIVGASGSFYGQRRALCRPFAEGMAPDFLSVLRTVEQGYRAVSEPTAIGSMTSVKDPKQEFDRKVRTLIRGMTTLFAYAHLLNPARFGLFAFALWSHKILRWTVPFFLVTALISSLALADSLWFLGAFLLQCAFYLGALAALNQYARFHEMLPGKVALYFSSVNLAILAAWYRYGRGVRQEIWTPSRR
jgi:glycosyltransferase involved in cell wall biosynthesis